MDGTASLRGEWFGVEHLPRGRLRIRVWPGIEAVTDGIPDYTGKVRWFEVRGRDLKPLQVPVRAFQPMSQKFWQGREPLPLPTSTLAKLEAPDTFDVTLAGAEMERDREEARAHHGLPAPEPLPQWWRDADLVKYEARGTVSARHGEARLMRALVTDRAIRVGMTPMKSGMAALAPMEILSELLSADPPEPPPPDWVPQLRPLPQDWADYLTAMAWLVEAGPSRQAMRILRARARMPPASWATIGDAIGKDWTRARQVYEATVAKVVTAANGRPRRSAARLKALQARNRRARL